MKEKPQTIKKETKPAVAAKQPEAQPKRERFIEAMGGRKTAMARVRLFNKQGTIMINGKSYTEYFKTPKNQATARAPLESLSLVEKFSVSAVAKGGGSNAQAEAVSNGLAKTLVKLNASFRKNLKRGGFLTRDARMVERKKYGLKKARRAPQWAKR